MPDLKLKDLYRLLNSDGIYPWSCDNKKLTIYTGSFSHHFTLAEFIEKCLLPGEIQKHDAIIKLFKGDSSTGVKLHINLPFAVDSKYFLVTSDPQKSGRGLIKAKNEKTWKQKGFEIIDTLPLGVLIKDMKDQGRYLYCNPRLIELHGVHERVEEMIGHTDRELYTEEEVKRYQHDDKEALKQGRCTYIGQFHAHDRHSTVIDTYKIPLFDKDGNPDLIIAIMEDVSESVLIRDELHQARKMEAMGMLAGGMAHDFNNMLTGIMGYTDLLLNNSVEDDPQREYLNVILASSQQAASLANTLLAFSRKQQIVIKKVDICSIIQEACTILVRTIDKRIHINKQCNEPHAYAKGDHTQILNIFLNLGLNARDAMAEGGCINIKLEKVILIESEMRKLNLEYHRYIRVIFSDTGSGIPQDIIDKVFDPFFSTKKTGEGTGLGLSTVYSSMKKFEGTIELTSELDKGTTFSLYFCPWED